MNKLIYIFILIIICAITNNAKKRVVYDTLIYTHYKHEKEYNVGDCDVCHTNITKSRRARDDNYADDQSCATAECHDIKNQDSCFSCHTNAEAETPIKPKREIKHSHKLHHEKEISCETCHSYIYKHNYFTRKEMVEMVVCTDCHKKRRVSTDCEICHTDPIIAFSHDNVGRNTHGDLFKHSQQVCNQCHTNSNCNFCHQGLVSKDVHPGNYRYTHKFDALTSRSNCRTCHRNSGSCDECHKKEWGKIVDHKKIIKNQTSCKSCHK